MVSNKKLYLCDFGVRSEHGYDAKTRLVWAGPDESISEKIFEYFDCQYTTEIQIVNLKFDEAIE
jgi:hypothetical protein